MSWLEIGALASGIVLQRIFGEVPPNKVIEVKNDSLRQLQLVERDEALILYGPPSQTHHKKTPYEIILLKSAEDSSSTSFSLFRANTKEEAKERFNCFRHRLSQFVFIVKEFYNINGLQKLCDMLSQNPSWSLAHLVAYFNLRNYVNKPRILEFIDVPDHKDYMTPLQLAIKCGSYETVKALMPLSNIEHLDKYSNSAYHYAAPTTKYIIKLLVDTSTVNLNHCNSDGFTPLHLACISDKPECVKALLLAGADVNIASSDKLQKPEVSSSKTAISNTLHTQDMKCSGTPLHWCSSREILQVLIEQGCDVNAQNFDGRTALHIMVTQNRLDCVITLLVHEAEIDIADKDGNTALHIAVEKKLVPIVQCLVVFGCDIDMKNKDGNTPRHMAGINASGGKEDEVLYILHSVGAKRCPASNTKCPPGCHAKGGYNGIPPVTSESVELREQIQELFVTATRNNFTSNASTPNLVDTTLEKEGRSVMDSILSAQTDNKAMDTEKGGSSGDQKNDGEKKYGRGRLLCLDGGGVRGLVLVQMLLEIEKLSQTPIVYLFDWIAGTSTGGILALGIAHGKTMRQCMGLYMKMKEQCFIGSRPYSSEVLESILKENLGEFTVMTDIKYPKIMVCTVIADRKPVDLHLFRNYTSASDILGIVTPSNNSRVPLPKPEEQLIWEAARATGAAPTYFRAFGRFLDGGLIANNPTLDAMTEIHEYNMALKSVGRDSEAIPISCVVSLGTGLIPVTELKEIDVFRPESIWDTAKLAFGLSALGNLLIDQSTATDGRVVDRARAWCSTTGIPYFRFSPQLTEDIELDEKSDQKLINMLWQAKAYIHSNRNKVIEMINLVK